MPFATKETFSRIWDDFFTKWNFPNGIHCIDGKHMKIKCPITLFRFPMIIVLQAEATACYRLTCTDVGSSSKEHDGGYFVRLSLFDLL
jgi:hypothetical protein